MYPCIYCVCVFELIYVYIAYAIKYVKCLRFSICQCLNVTFPFRPLSMHNYIGSEMRPTYQLVCVSVFRLDVEIFMQCVAYDFRAFERWIVYKCLHMNTIFNMMFGVFVEREEMNRLGDDHRILPNSSLPFLTAVFYA